jgi:subtilisin-like proprotein convertase family protein
VRRDIVFLAFAAVLAGCNSILDIAEIEIDTGASTDTDIDTDADTDTDNDADTDSDTDTDTHTGSDTDMDSDSDTDTDSDSDSDTDTDTDTDSDVDTECDGVVCDQVPDDKCESDTSVWVYPEEGYCEGGDCFYDPVSTPCESPPGDYCVSGTEIFIYSTDGICDYDAGACEYDGGVADCDDGEFCTGIESCSLGVCEHSGNPCPDDGLACTTQCDDEVNDCNILQAGYCIIDETCRSHGEQDPGNLCQECDTAASTSAWTVDTDNSCDDGKFCTGDESCSTGTCTHTGDPCIDDGLLCTTTCDEGANACNTINTGYCVIDSTCRTNGELNPDNPCKECKTSASKTEWTNDNNNTCEDEDFCTGTESCSGGVCNHTGSPCSDDGLDCTLNCDSDAGACNTINEDYCVIDGKCRNDGDPDPSNLCRECDVLISNTAWTNDDENDCDDGEFCTGTEDCSGGACNHTGNPCVDDGLACTEICNETANECNTINEGYCVIDNTCRVNGEEDSENTCRECDTSISKIAWTNDDNNECDDGIVCTGNDACSDGECSGTDCEDIDCLGGNCLDDKQECIATGCVDCNNNDDCDTGFVCDTSLHACVTCLYDDDCSDGYWCNAGTCDDCNEAAHCGVSCELDCTSNYCDACNPDNQICALDGLDCVDCLDETNCDSGHYCASDTCTECAVDEYCGPGCDDCTAFGCPECAKETQMCNSNGSGCVDCVDSGDCLTGYICYNDNCVECVTDIDCSTGYWCNEGVCDNCNEPAHCGASCELDCTDDECDSDFCDDGYQVCRAEGTKCVDCVENSDCASGYRCDDSNECVIGCPGTGGIYMASTPDVCWYLGATGESCSTVCASQGTVYDAATASFAGDDGSGGTNAHCEEVQDALGVDGTTVTGVACTDALGCVFGFSQTQTQTWTSTDVPKSIPDNNSLGVTSTVNVNVHGTITDVNLKITGITHTYDADLDIYLIHPDATQVILSTDNGAADNNYTNTVFDDEASTSITTGSAPFTGSYRPEGSLTGFDGKDPYGTWTLKVVDDASGDTGTLTGWEVTIMYTAGTSGRTRCTSPTTTSVASNTFSQRLCACKRFDCDDDPDCNGGVGEWCNAGFCETCNTETHCGDSCLDCTDGTHLCQGGNCDDENQECDGTECLDCVNKDDCAYGYKCNESNVCEECIPNSIEVPEDGLDNDCDGQTDEAETCSCSPTTGQSASAMDCATEIACYSSFLNFSQMKAGSGSSFGFGTSYGGIDQFGSSNDLAPHAGASYGSISTGQVTENNNHVKILSSSWHPVDPYDSQGANMYDAIEYAVNLTAPANVHGFSFDFVFFSSEYDEYVGTDYNDKFYVWLNAPTTTGGTEKIINYTDCRDPGSYFDFSSPQCNLPSGYCCYIAINTSASDCCWYDGCPGGTGGTDISNTGYSCGTQAHENALCTDPSGTYSSIKCGYDTGSSTGWLRTSWNIEPGEIFTLTFHIHDTYDPIFDSQAIIDNFTWHTDEVVPGTEAI